MAEYLPEWAHFFRTADRLERFEAAVVADFVRRGVQVAIEDGRIIPMHDLPDQELRSLRWGLSNIGQRCALEEDEAQWPGLIAAHFDIAIRATAGREHPDFADFESIRARLALRIWEPADLENLEGAMCAMELIPELAAVLCLDEEHSIATIRQEDADATGQPLEELFNIAMENISSWVQPEVERVDVDGTELVSIASESPYTSSLALDLQRFAGLLGPHGAIVAIPTRDTILLLPIHGIQVTQEIAKLMFIASGMYADGPGSVTPRVYWYHQAEWREISYRCGDDGLHVAPPPEFIELLESLAEA